MALADSATFDQRSPWGRGVLASYDAVTPNRADEIAKHKITVRDAVLVLIGCAGMYGAQVARDSGLRSDMRNLQTSFEDARESQQKEIALWRAETKLNAVDLATVQKEVAELKGILMGAGIKGLPK
jgi:hypothetical protein